MKQIQVIILLLLLSAIFFSCTKDTDQGSQAGISTNNPAINNNSSFVNTYISPWNRIAMRAGVRRNGVVVKGRLDFPTTPVFDFSSSVSLAYLKRPGNVYCKLPISIGYGNNDYYVDFSVNNIYAEVVIHNSNSPGELPPTDFYKNNEYRFIILPRKDYLANNLDWNNYLAVAAAFNLSR